MEFEQRTPPPLAHLSAPEHILCHPEYDLELFLGDEVISCIACVIRHHVTANQVGFLWHSPTCQCLGISSAEARRYVCIKWLPAMCPCVNS